MRRMKKQLSILTACMLLFCLLVTTVWAAPTETCPGGCAHQAAVGSTHYDALAEAISAAAPGSVVTLLADVTADTALTVDKAITLDLGGKTLSGSDALVDAAVLSFTQDCTLKNGKVTASAGAAVMVVDSTLILEKDAVLEGSTSMPALILYSNEDLVARAELSGTVTGKENAPAVFASGFGCSEILVLEDAQLTSEEGSAIDVNGSAMLEVSGGSITAKGDTLRFSYLADQALELTVSGGTICTEEGELFAFTTEDGMETPTGFVTGGTFSHSPSRYLAPGYRVLKNKDGTYTVAAVHTLSFDANGGKGKMTAKQVTDGDSVKLPKCTFTAPKGKEFKGWQIGSKTYSPGDSVTITENLTAKALWKTHTHTGGKATCESKAQCKTCGEKYGSIGSHKLKSVGGYDATCTEGGLNAHSKCTVCGKRFVNGEKISLSALSTPKLGHELTAVEGREATCTETGLLAHEECEYCGLLRADGKKISKSDLVIPVSGHAMETVEAVPATCTQTGVKAHERCTHCDTIFLNGEAVELDQLTTDVDAHLLSDWVSDNTAHWKACVDCGATFRKHSHSDTDQDGTCDDCAYALAVPQEQTEPAEEEPSFSFAYLIPVLAAVAIAVPLAVKKRKQ